MKKLIIILLLLSTLIIPVSASELTAPEVPDSGRALMPEDTASFAQGLQQLLQKSLLLIRPDLAEASRVSVAVTASVILVSVLGTFSGPTKQTADFAGVVAIVSVLLFSTNSLIRLGAETVEELSQYGKLLLPVMTAAMAAQGGVTGSAALYGGTAAFSALLSSLISRLLIPMVYLFLALSTANSALGQDMLKSLGDLVKTFVSWCLKTLLTVFTTYMGITGILSGSTDAAALKATKVTISTFVPVVGGILSDASEAVLVGAGLAKNAAGLYGIFAMLALFLGPFLKIGVHYLILKATAAISSLFGTKRMSALIGDFSTAMGLLLGMTGSACLLQMISTICFLKGVG